MWSSVAGLGTVELECPECNRRYRVNDSKVRGRRARANCKCGNKLIADGRHLEEGRGPTSESAPDTASTAGSQRLARVSLRRISTSVPAPATPSRRPTAPSLASTSDEPTASNSSEAAADLTEAFSLLQERQSPVPLAREQAPASRKVSAPGEEPEVVVHYPPHWRPPPSERRRRRESFTARWSQHPAQPAEPTTSEASEPALDSTPEPLTVSSNEEPQQAAAVDSKREATHSVPAPPPPETAHIDSTAPSAMDAAPPSTTEPRSSDRRLVAGFLSAAVLLGLILSFSGSDPDTTSVQPPAVDPVPAAPSEPLRGNDDTAPSEPMPRAPVQSEPGPTPKATPKQAKLAPKPAPAPAKAPSATTATQQPALPAAGQAPKASPQPITQPAPPSVAPATAEPAEPKPVDDSPYADAESPIAAATPSPAGKPDLDLTLLKGVLSEASTKATSCAAEDGPSGAGTVRVSLDPAGGVLRADILGEPFAGTSVGRCVQGIFASARTPAYAGRTQSTVYSFRIP